MDRKGREENSRKGEIGKEKMKRGEEKREEDSRG